MNSEDLLIVDGYNILSSWNLGVSKYNLQAARFDLEEILADFSGYKAMDIILVFDAHQSPNHGCSYRKYRLQIIYTKTGETADTKIEGMLKNKLKDYRYVYVATADYTLQLFSLGEGGLRITPTELKSMINNQSKKGQ